MMTYSGFIPNNIPFCFPNDENGISFNFDMYLFLISSGIFSKSPPYYIF